MKIIKDQIMKPFKIKISDQGFTIIEKIGKNPKGELVHKVHGYYINIESALKKVLKLLIARDIPEDKSITLEEYLGLLKRYNKDLNAIINNFNLNKQQ